MFSRFTLLAFMLFALAACQTGNTDTDGALSTVVGEGANNAAKPEDAPSSAEENSAPKVDPVETVKAEEAKPEAKPEPKVEATPEPPKGDAIEASMAEIAAIRKSQGERGAVTAIFACYEKARAKSASLEQAKICAAQDFAVSREIIVARPENATGTGDRALLVSKRHASRIGALLQFKGMSQSQFNTFGRYLHAVAEPAYKKARRA